MPENKETTSRSNSSRSKPQRSKEENRERAFLAASRRTDRPLKDRYESALRASAIHKQRTGRSLRVTKEMVEKDEMYEEVDESLAKEYRRLTADLRAEAAVLSRKLQENYFQAFATQNVQMNSSTPQLMTPGGGPKDAFAWMNSDFNSDDLSSLQPSKMLPDGSMTGMLDGLNVESFNEDWFSSEAMWAQMAATGPPTPSSLHSGPSSMPQTPAAANMYTLSPEQSWPMNLSPQMHANMPNSYDFGANDAFDNTQSWNYRPRSSTAASSPMPNDFDPQMHARQWSWDGVAPMYSANTNNPNSNSRQYKYNPNGGSR